MSLRSILLVSARFQKENLYREIALKHIFEKRGIDVKFFLPSRKLNRNGYTDEIVNDTIFKNENARYITSIRQFIKNINKCDAVVFGSWKQYSDIAEIARRKGKMTINFNSTSGLDHWPHSVDYALVKGHFSKRFMLYVQQNLPGHGNLTEDRIHVLGSIIHDAPDYLQQDHFADREAFFRKYNLELEKPLAILFPKGIGTQRAKISMMFREWDSIKCQDWCNRLSQKYKEICTSSNKAEFNLIVKMHPTAYTSYMTNYSDEYKFWSEIKEVSILDVSDTYECYRYMDVGLGVNTHAALDTAYYGKPFIFIDSEEFELPQLPQFDFSEIWNMPFGPSSHWDSTPLGLINPWCPSWLGYYSNIKNLKDLLISLDFSKENIEQSHREIFVKEFWHKNDGKTAERIVDKTIELYDRDNYEGNKSLSPFFKQFPIKGLKEVIKNLGF